MNRGGYIGAVNWLTNQEWRVIRVVSLLLVTGLVVKFYRPSHAPGNVTRPVAATIIQPAKP